MREITGPTIEMQEQRGRESRMMRPCERTKALPRVRFGPFILVACKRLESWVLPFWFWLQQLSVVVVVYKKEMVEQFQSLEVVQVQPVACRLGFARSHAPNNSCTLSYRAPSMLPFRLPACIFTYPQRSHKQANTNKRREAAIATRGQLFPLPFPSSLIFS